MTIPGRFSAALTFSSSARRPSRQFDRLISRHRCRCAWFVERVAPSPPSSSVFPRHCHAPPGWYVRRRMATVPDRDPSADASSCRSLRRRSRSRSRIARRRRDRTSRPSSSSSSSSFRHRGRMSRRTATSRRDLRRRDDRREHSGDRPSSRLRRRYRHRSTASSRPPSCACASSWTCSRSRGRRRDYCYCRVCLHRDWYLQMTELLNLQVWRGGSKKFGSREDSRRPWPWHWPMPPSWPSLCLPRPRAMRARRRRCPRILGGASSLTSSSRRSSLRFDWTTRRRDRAGGSDLKEQLDLN